MSITPLYTAAELDTKITALKNAEDSLLSGVAEYTVDLGSSRRQVRKRDLSEIRDQLAYFQNERVKLSIGGGPQAIVGRVFRG